MLTKQATSSSQQTGQRQVGTIPRYLENISGIRMLIFLGCLAFAWGCSTNSTPLYYTSKSSLEATPVPAAAKQATKQPAAPPQVVQQHAAPQQAVPQQAAALQAAPQPQTALAKPNYGLQQQLMLQAARVSQSSYRDYKVGPEDLLFIDVYGQEGLRRELRVNGLGQISMPLVGVIKVGGLTTQQIENRLREEYGSQYLKNPQITVEVKEFHHQRVAVTGAVMKPGYYDIIGPRTLLEVLSMAGGIGNKPGPEAGDVVHVIQHQSSADASQAAKNAGVRAYAPESKTIVINMQRLVSGQAPELNLMVENGDVVYVPFAGNAYVLGGVRKPGNVTVKENLTIAQAVAMAQGIDPLYGTSKIIIMRFDDQGRPTQIQTDLKDITAGKEIDIPVKDNDAIVVVEGELKKKLYVLRQLLPIPSGGYSIPTR